MSNRRTIKATIRGKVQGVWFRDSTRQQANTLHITGYANNQQDGSVEVLATGTPESIDQLIIWLHQGPTNARVDSVDIIDTPEGPYVDFSIG